MSASIALHDPVVVSQAPPELRNWGPWQFPSIQRLPDGRLVVAFHVEADSATAYGLPRQVAVSEDEGETWQPAEGDEAAVLTSPWIQLPDGELLRQVHLRSIDPETVGDQLPAVVCETEGGYNNPLTVFDARQFPVDLTGYRFARRRAGSDEWVKERATVNVPGAIRAIYMGVLTFPWMQRIVPAPDGSLWGVNHGKRLVDGGVQEKHGALFVRSVDAGHTWDLLGEIPYQPDESADPHAAERDGFTEPNVAFLPDGSVLCLLRTTDANGVGPMYVSRSTDGGLTWSRPEIFDDLGVWPALAVLGCGVTLAAYGRPGLFVRTAADPAARRWEERVPVIERLEQQRDTCSYSDLLPMSDTEALIAYSDFSWPDGQGRPRKTILVRQMSVGAAAREVRDG